MTTLAALCAGVPGVTVDGDAAVTIRALVLDSRAAAPGALFAALAGARADGRAFVGDAVARGAVAALGAGPRPADLAPHVAWVAADAPRAALAAIARRFHGAPDERLDVVGITGTNGKTSTAHYLAAALGAGGRACAVGGTLGMSFGTVERPGALTTAEAPDLFSFLDEAAAAGARAAALEVSSAALIADRVEGMRFAAAVLTNVGHDHLDLHGTHAAYRAAKCRLFTMLPAGAPAVLPADDPFVAEFRAAASAARVITFAADAPADWVITRHAPFRDGRDGASFHVEGPAFAGEVVTRRPGLWDARNITAAVATATALGVDPHDAIEGAASVPFVAGRLEPVDEGQPFAAWVDFAHTPEALARALETVRATTAGRVIAVFGCGGERDPGKRPAMGRLAGELADVVLVTDDNPRGEDPEAIAAAILAGCAGTPAVARRAAPREAAIEEAVALARPGDAIVIAGKGHETYQEIGGRKIAFDDRLVLRTKLRAAGAHR